MSEITKADRLTEDFLLLILQPLQVRQRKQAQIKAWRITIQSQHNYEFHSKKLA